MGPAAFHATDAELRSPLRELDPADGGRSVGQQVDVDAPERANVVDADWRSERPARIARERGEDVPLVAGGRDADDVRPRGEELAELHVCGAELFERGR